MADLNIWSDVSSIALTIQEDAYFIVRDGGIMQNLVTSFRDASGMNTRTSYKYNAGTAQSIADSDDLTSHSFTPSADQILTPSEIGLQFFVTDARMESDLPENWMRDASIELGRSALDKVETDLSGDMASLTAGTGLVGAYVGSAGSAISWSSLAAAIAQARGASKSNSVPLSLVIHGYQWAVLAKSASIAGATVAPAPSYQDEITRKGFVAEFMGVPIFQTFISPDGSDDFKGGVFPREAIAIDWRRPVRVELDRDPSRRGWEVNMSAIYAHGVWRPDLGVYTYFDASRPTS